MMYLDTKTLDELKTALQERADSAKGFVKTYTEKLTADPEKALHEMGWRHLDAMQEQCRHDVAQEVLHGVESMADRGNEFDAILGAVRWTLLRETLNGARDTGTSSNSSSNMVRRFKLAERAALFHDLFGGPGEPPKLK